ncbi:DUF1003 domain-containing protein [Gulosibacter bifidus]|uniref:DUF1003 domain-containing protein n=1 Tax=Gulosibacter bifidus TaxID=272239 RepID=A0ABW5RGX4_9MICO|nr:DUF1003 domain-containing protein [Gulosibacter bifidus]
MAEIDQNDELLSVPKSATKAKARPPRERTSSRDRSTSRNASSDRNERGDRSDRNERGERKERKERTSGDLLGRSMEAIARGMGTPAFLIILSVFVAAWMMWNSMAPKEWRFDSADLGFIALTLALSLQASYAAPMLLLAQNRQDDRDRVQIEQDRQRAERQVADLEYLTREMVALRMLASELASKDFVRAEVRSIAEELEQRQIEREQIAAQEAARLDSPHGAPNNDQTPPTR